MLRCFRLPAIGFTLVAMLVFAGCGGGGAPVAEVQGKVMLDGKPLAAGCAVTFLPDTSKGTKGATSGAKTEADGGYVLVCGTGQKGALIGFHKVVIRPPFDEAKGGSSPTGAAPVVAPGPKVVIPRKYTDVVSTDLLFEVKKGIVNEITLELKSK